MSASLSLSPWLCRPQRSLITHITFLLHHFPLLIIYLKSFGVVSCIKTPVFPLAMAVSLCSRLWLCRGIISCGQNILLTLCAHMLAPAPARGFSPSREIQTGGCTHSLILISSHPTNLILNFSVVAKGNGDISLDYLPTEVVHQNFCTWFSDDIPFCHSSPLVLLYSFLLMCFYMAVFFSIYAQDSQTLRKPTKAK